MKYTVIMCGGALATLVLCPTVSCSKNNAFPPQGGRGAEGGSGGEGGDGASGGSGGSGGLAGAGGNGDGGSGGSVGDPCLGDWWIYNNAQFEELVLADCTEIKGYLNIGNKDLTSLEGLESLTSIGGFLDFTDSVGLTSLAGLDNLASVGGYLKLPNQPALASVEALKSLSKVGGDLRIELTLLTSLQGLEKLTSVGGNLDITSNLSLRSLGALAQIESAGSLKLFYNTGLTVLDPLHDWPAKAVKGELYIAINRSLPQCEVDNFDAAQTDPDAQCATTGDRQCLGNNGEGTCE